MTALHARGIVKHYGAVAALRGVDFTAHPGAVNVLIGENGAGKSTLMRIVAGVETPDAGRILLGDRPLRLASVHDAAAAGIGIVHQELNLCPNLTVTENIFLGHPLSRRGVVDAAAEHGRARAVLDRLGAAIDPAALVGDLRVGEQQLVEIARVLSTDVSVLILDEPTSALSATEVDRLFAVLDQLRRDGTVIIYISHRLEELIRIGDHVTVLRDGALVATAAVPDIDVEWIVERMLGRPRTARQDAGRPAAGAVALAVEDLTVTGRHGMPLVASLSAAFRAGQVTAIYGLLGAGRSELFAAIAGIRPARGAVRLGDRDLAGQSIRDRQAAGLQYVAEDRQADGIFANLAIGANLGIGFLDRLTRFGVIGERDEDGTMRSMIGRLGIKAPVPALSIGTLSGGNQQKVLIGRALLPGPRVLLLDEPGRGVDMGARAEIFRVMRGLADGGMAVVFATSDLDEALDAGDRVMVMAGGRITADLAGADATREALVRAANRTVAPPATAPEAARAA